jgi:hypothetical protein
MRPLETAGIKTETNEINGKTKEECEKEKGLTIGMHI